MNRWQIWWDTSDHDSGEFPPVTLFHVQRQVAMPQKRIGTQLAFTSRDENLARAVAVLLNAWEDGNMADVKDLFYHGVRHQIRRVLQAMGQERIEMGLNAFENGASTWSACFFAQAYPEVNLRMGDPEAKIAELLGMPGNKVPMRIVYRTFDSVGMTMTKQGLMDFIRGFLDESRDPSVQKGIDELLGGVKFDGAEEDAVDFNKCAVVNHQPGWMEREQGWGGAE